MRQLLISSFLLFLPALYGGDESGKKYLSGLAAHYFSDPQNWNGNWPDSQGKPSVAPEKWTFTRFDKTRVEPLVNKGFIKESWFSIRIQGWIEIPTSRRKPLDA